MERVWSVREYREGDEEGIFNLTEAVHGAVPDKDQWMRWWRWMNRDNPAGTARIWLAEHDGRIVGQETFISMRMKVSKEIQKATQSADLMTHPGYRHQGISLELGRQGLDEVGKLGEHIVIGFANDASYSRNMKLGWLDLGSLQTMIKPIKLENILEKHIPSKMLTKLCAAFGRVAIGLLYRTKKPPPVRGLTIAEISSFDERIDDFWNKVSNDYSIMCVRDRAYLNWRYVSKPDGEYTIYVAEKEGETLGYMVLRCVELRGLVCGRIIDIIAPHNREEIIHSLVSKAIEHFEQETASLIVCKMIGPKAYLNVFKRSGFISPRFLNKRFPFVVYTDVSQTSAKFIRDPKHWFVQEGDSDSI